MEAALLNSTQGVIFRTALSVRRASHYSKHVISEKKHFSKHVHRHYRRCGIDPPYSLLGSSPVHHTAMLDASTKASTRRPFFLGPLHGKARGFAQAAMGRGRAWWALGVHMSGKGATRERVVYLTVARGRAHGAGRSVSDGSSPRLQPKETCARLSTATGRICVWADVISIGIPFSIADVSSLYFVPAT